VTYVFVGFRLDDNFKRFLMVFVLFSFYVGVFGFVSYCFIGLV